MRFHQAVLDCHAQFGGDLEDMQRRYDEGSTAMTDIPADVMQAAREAFEEADAHHSWAEAVNIIARAIMADRAARETPSEYERLCR